MYTTFIPIGTKKVRFFTPNGKLYYDVVPEDATFVILKKINLFGTDRWLRMRFISDPIEGELKPSDMEGECSMVLLVPCE